MRASELHRLARVLRKVALDATENTGSEHVNAGQLAVFEDIAHHPGSSIREITERTGLAQSLVSRIVRAAAAEGSLSVSPDAQDRRRVRIDFVESARTAALDRAENPVEPSLIAHTLSLSDSERRTLAEHLRAAYDLISRDSS